MAAARTAYRRSCPVGVPATNTVAISGKRPLAARSAHDEITERTQVLVPADDDEPVADPHDL